MSLATGRISKDELADWISVDIERLLDKIEVKQAATLNNDIALCLGLIEELKKEGEEMSVELSRLRKAIGEDPLNNDNVITAKDKLVKEWVNRIERVVDIEAENTETSVYAMWDRPNLAFYENLAKEGDSDSET